MSNDWITTTEAAQLVGYHREHIRRLIADGKITAKKFGRDWQVSRSSLLTYVRRAEKFGAKRGPKKRS